MLSHSFEAMTDAENQRESTMGIGSSSCPVPPVKKRGQYESMSIEIENTNNHSDTSSGGQMNRELVKLVIVAAMTASTLGYDVGSMAGAIGSIESEFHLNGVQKELAMGSLNFIAAGGAIIGGPVADRYGRKKTVALTCWLFLLGTVLMASATNYALLLIGRMVAGLGVGVAFIFSATVRC